MATPPTKKPGSIPVKRESLKDSEANFTWLFDLDRTDNLGPKIEIAQGNVTPANHRQGGAYVLVGQGATLAGLAKAFTELWKPAPAWVRAASGGKVKEGAYKLDPVKLEALGVVLFEFATEVWTGAALDANETNVGAWWQVGTLFPLPALPTLAPASSLIVNIDGLEIKSSSDLPPGIKVRDPCGELRAFDPFRYPTPVSMQSTESVKAIALEEVQLQRDQVLTVYQGDVAAGQRQWAARLQWNPYAAAFPLVHLISVLPAAAATALVRELFGANSTLLTQDQLDQIAKTSGGAVVLRTAFRKTPNGGATRPIRDRLAALIGCDPVDDPSSKKIRFAALEPPAVGGEVARSRRDIGYRYSSSFMGRIVDFKWDAYQAWKGPTDQGSLYPGIYLDQPHAPWTGKPGREAIAEVGDSTNTKLSEAQLGDRLAVILSIFESEGYSDGIRGADRALVSVGLQQFSFHVEDEATRLVRRIRFLNEDWFDVIFRSAGLEVGVSPHDSNGKPVDLMRLGGKQSTKDKLGAPIRTPYLPAIASPVASSATTSSQLDDPAWLIQLREKGSSIWCVPGSVGTIDNVPAYPSFLAGNPVPSADDPKTHTDCLVATGYDGFVAGEKTDDLLARWAIGARMVPEFTRAQIEMCVHRFKRLELAAEQPVADMFLSDPTKPAPTTAVWSFLFKDLPGTKPTFRQLVSSIAMVAAVLDCFINTPNHTLPAIRRAYDRAVEGWTAEFAVELNMRPPAIVFDYTHPAFRLRILLAFLSERRRFTKLLAPPVPQWDAGTSLSARGKLNVVAAPRVGVLTDYIGEPVKTRRVLDSHRIDWMTDFNW